MLASCEVDAKTVADISNFTIHTLKLLWDGCTSLPTRIVKERCNAVQAKVHDNVVKSVLRMFDRLSGECAQERISDALNCYSHLVASLVKMCPTACTCDAMS